MKGGRTDVCLTLWVLLVGYSKHLYAQPSIGKQETGENPNRSCPDFHAIKVTFPGCPCQPEENPSYGACPKGFQCAPYSEKGNISATCVPCVYGQYCPEGSFLPSPYGTVDLHRQYVDKYSCKPGFVCPTPDTMLPCPPGAFCPKASVSLTSCDYAKLLEKSPQTVIPAQPVSVEQKVNRDGNPILGNICPPESTTPQTPCPKGFFCPNASSIQPCPKAHFCKWYTTKPKHCPILAKCPPKSASANLSLGGFFGLMLILFLLWLAYIALSSFVRMQEERLVTRQGAKDKLQQIVAPILSLHDPQAVAIHAYGNIKPRLSLRFEDLGLQLRDGRKILSGVTGYFGHSKVSAIMGPSGCGKSTLLSVLMGNANYGTYQGQIWINGRGLRVSKLRRIVGYVPQDDILHNDLTVRENLAYSAWLRSTINMVSEAKGEVVGDVIDLLRLRNVQHSLVGSVEKRGISGGQRKRVNIGMELVAKPSLLFMDEPTSGLDSTAATDILSALRKMAGLGMNIVMVIHQPRFSVFSLFHEVLFLGKQGRAVFRGPSPLALMYFTSIGFDLPANENPADFCLDVISGVIQNRKKSDFQPEDLDDIWEAEARKWEGASAQEENRSIFPTPIQLNPEQMRLISGHFQKLHLENSDNLTVEDITRFLTELELEPESQDAELLMQALDPKTTGFVSKEDFLQFIRNGGRTQKKKVLQTLESNLSIDLDADRAAQVPAQSLVRENGALHAPESNREHSDLGNGAPESDLPPNSSHLVSASSFDLPSSYNAVRITDSLPHSDRGFLTKILHDEEGRLNGDSGMSPSVSQIWDYETMSTFSQPTTLDDLIEEESPSQRFYLTEVILKCAACCNRAGRSCGKFWRRNVWRKQSKFRSIPGTWAQFKLLLRRAGLKWIRGWGHKFVNLLLFIFFAIVIGAVHGTAWELEKVRGNVTLAMLPLAVLSGTASLGVFGNDTLVFRRESGSGLRTGAYFLGNAALNMVDITVQPLVYMSVYYTLTLPEISFVHYYGVAWLVAWYATGLGYWFSLAFSKENSMIACAGALLMMGGFLNGVDPRYRTLSHFMKHVLGLSFGRWAVEAVTIQEFRQYEHYMQPRTRRIMMEVGYCGLDKEDPGTSKIGAKELDVMTYCRGYVAWDLTALLIQGLVLRIVTYIWLRICQDTRTENPLYSLFKGFWRSCQQRTSSLNCLSRLPVCVRNFLFAGAMSEQNENLNEPLLGGQTAPQ